jgi:hypothetical protein
MYEFDAGNRRCCFPKFPEAEHRDKPELDRSMILFDRGSDLTLLATGMFAENLFGRTM